MLIVSATLLLLLKVDDVWQQAGEFGFRPALAQSESKDDAAAAAGKEAGDAEKKMAKDDIAKNAEAMGAKDISDYSAAELKVLQSLAKRREEIDSRNREVQMREAILTATERRIDGKIEELKKLEATIQALIISHDAEAEKRIRSIVKVYENMKPKDAARIFEDLDMTILIDVAERMKEVKMAAVMARMDPEKARTLTVQLATRRQLPATGG